MSKGTVYTGVAGSQSGYARHRKERGLPGGTPQAVSKAIKSGRLKRAIREDGLIDFSTADREWPHNGQLRIVVNNPPPASEERPDGDGLLSARIRRERAEAALAELKAARASGEVVDVVEARSTFHAIGRIYAAGREALPSQLASRLIGKVDLVEIEKILREALRQADVRCVDEITARFGNFTMASEGG